MYEIECMLEQSDRENAEKERKRCEHEKIMREVRDREFDADAERNTK